MNAMKTQARLTTWLDGCSRASAERGPGLNAQEGERFIAMLATSRVIRGHGDLLAWLRDMRVFLPHQMLIAAWGNFQRWNIKSEVVSHLPGARLAPSRGCALDDILREAHAHWLRGGREPLVLGTAALGGLRNPCSCVLHASLRGMRSLLVHGVRDKLSGCDSLYIALDTQSLFAAGGETRLIALAHLLLCQVDAVWRRVAAYRLENLRGADVITLPRGLELSPREREILASLARGSTNHDIAEGLAISLFTVKNHLKRIFRKIGVSNRTQAAACFNQAAMQSGAMQSANNAVP
jgi:transcriptional regulator EpsA